MIGDALRLSTYFGDSLTNRTGLVSDALMGLLVASDVRLAVLLRGIEGFGINRRIHAERLPDISTDLPLLAMAVDERERIRALLDRVDRVVPRGLVTLEPVVLATGRDVAHAGFPVGRGAAAKLTIHCGRGETIKGRPAYREIVDVLRRHGAGGAIVLLGVDGAVEGRRTKARFLRVNHSTPLVIVSIGAPRVLERSLPDLAECLRNPIVTLETVAMLKHDGERQEVPPAAHETDGDFWLALGIYTRLSAVVHGGSLHSELTRRIRKAGGAGVTTILGEWGFSRDEQPYGDRFGRLASHLPTYTVYVDRPHKVAELWPTVDHITAKHGLVTGLVVPGYRESAGDTVDGALWDRTWPRGRHGPGAA